MANAAEYLGMVFHGLETTHVDALSHVFYQSRLYNDRAAFHTNAEFGSTWGAITQLADGVVGRGVLLDVPRAQGLDLLPRGHGVSPDELAATAAAQGVEVGPGDVVLLRTGRWHERSEVKHLASSTEARAVGIRPACRGCTSATSRCSAATGHRSRPTVGTASCPPRCTCSRS